MRLHHTALVRTSESRSDRFFCEVLKLERVREKSASAELCGALFGVEREHKMIDYAGDQVQFEVFLAQARENVSGHLGHVCLEVNDADGLLQRCVDAGVEIREVAKGEGKVVFLVDDDGNLYEIKRRAQTR